MTRTIRAAGSVAVAMLLAVCVPLAVAADDETGWSDTAELGLTLTRGNSEADSFNFRNTLTRKWDDATFVLGAGGLRVDTTTTTRVAVGSPTSFSVAETDTSTTTAENYYLRGRYDKNISETFFWFAGAGWERNEFAGFDNRYIAEGGVGNIWRDDDDVKFRTRYGATWTKQDDIVETPGTDDSFLGGRFAWEYLNKLNESTTFGNDLLFDVNLDETDDWRADMINALTVAMTERMALKLSLQFLYDNMPSLVAVSLFDATGAPLGSVTVEADELDTIFNASLVVNF